jgi:hypothetical protein
MFNSMALGNYFRCFHICLARYPRLLRFPAQDGVENMRVIDRLLADARKAQACLTQIHYLYQALSTVFYHS